MVLKLIYSFWISAHLAVTQYGFLVTWWILWGYNRVLKQVIMTYLWDHTARSDTVINANHTLVIRVLSSPQIVLIAHVVGPLIHHEAATLHPDGVASVEVGVKIGTVAAALMRAPLEVSVFVKNDLQKQQAHTDTFLQSAVRSHKNRSFVKPQHFVSLPFPWLCWHQTLLPVLSLSQATVLYKKERKKGLLCDCTA